MSRRVIPARSRRWQVFRPRAGWGLIDLGFRGLRDEIVSKTLAVFLDDGRFEIDASRK
jgi:hypothetical protein